MQKLSFAREIGLGESLIKSDLFGSKEGEIQLSNKGKWKG